MARRHLYLLLLFGLLALGTTPRVEAGSPFLRTGAAPAAVDDPYLLDEYPDAYAAYSLRKLRSDYSGPAVRVRRNSDNAEQDFSFAANGDLDIVAIENWLSGADGRVVKWYDQSANGNDLAQTTNDYQPWVAEGGTVVTDDAGYAAVYFDGGGGSEGELDRFLTGTYSNPPNSGDVGFFTVTTPEELGNFGEEKPLFGFDITNDPRNTFKFIMDTAVKVEYGDNNQGTTYAFSGIDAFSRQLYSARIDGTNVEAWNTQESLGTQTLSDPSGTGENVYLGGTGASKFTPSYKGYVNELVLFPALTESGHDSVIDAIDAFYEVTPSGANENALLPQDYEYQVVLYDWMETLGENDFDVPLGGFSWDVNDPADNEELYRHWLALGNNVPPDNRTIRNSSSNYVLDNGSGGGIEGSGTVRLMRQGNGEPIAGATAWWTVLDVPGNPFFDHAGVKRRALVTAAVDMMMTDEGHVDGTAWLRADFLGGALLDWAYTYYRGKDVLSATEQAAFEAGFSRMLDKLERIGPHDVTTNMDTRNIPAFVYLHEATADQAMKDRCVEMAKLFLFGSKTGSVATTDPIAGIFHKAGYIGEQDGPETSYNGLSLLNLVNAAAVVDGVPEWSFLHGTDQVVDRMLDFKRHQAFGNPNGTYNGPSGYAKRTVDPYVGDQSARYWREAAAAMLSSKGTYLVRGIRSGVDWPTPATMEGEISSEVTTLNNEFSSPETAVPTEWSHKWWQEEWPFAYDEYQSGFYGGTDAEISGNDEVTYPPFDNDSDINKSFNDEFWAYKANDGAQDFGFFVDTVPDAGGGFGGYKGGGSLHTFWSENGGIMLLSRLPNKHDAPEGDYSNIELWPVAHVWGRDDKATPTAFSTAEQRSKSNVNYDLAATNPTVTQELPFDEEDGDEIQGSVSVDMTMTAQSDGIQIAQTINSDQSDSVTELWASIPIHLREVPGGNVPGDNASTETTIEYWDGAGWVNLTSTEVSTQYIRLGRDWGGGPVYSYITFGSARDVKLSSQVFETDYQRSTRTRQLMADIHPTGDGTVQPLPSTISVTYTVQTTNPVDGTPPPPEGAQDIALQEGWNLVSTTVAPDEPSMEALFEDISADVEVVRNKDGAVYNPGNGTNDIGSWDANEAYAVFNSAAATLSLQGVDIDLASTPLLLQEGWNWVPYLPKSAMPVGEALDSIQDHLVIVKGEDGRVYYPAEGTDNLEQMQPGKGYKVYVDQDVSLTYPDGN